jgi:hypothetical protein
MEEDDEDDYDPELDEGEFDEGGGRGGEGGDAYLGAGGEKKKVGRPIAYKGDPNAPHLTEEERRRIKRCLSRLLGSLLAYFICCTAPTSQRAGAHALSQAQAPPEFTAVTAAVRRCVLDGAQADCKPRVGAARAAEAAGCDGRLAGEMPITKCPPFAESIVTHMRKKAPQRALHLSYVVGLAGEDSTLVYI